MPKHKLVELIKIINERIGSLAEEVEIATNVKLNSLKDEISSLQWAARIINWILDHTIDGRQPLGIVTRSQLELEDIKKFENMVQDRIQVLEIELDDSNSTREKEVLVNEIHTLKCVLGHLNNVKPGGDETRATSIAETINNYHVDARISAQLQN